MPRAQASLPDSISRRALGGERAVVKSRVQTGLPSPPSPAGGTSMEGQVLRHRALYKAAPTPPWRDTFRQRCVTRLKSSRARLLERYRRLGENVAWKGSDASLVQEVMEVEWQALQSADVLLPSLEKQDALPQVLEDAEQAVWEEIQQELIMQDQLALEEYERSLQFDEECLKAMVDGLDAECQVICPVCRRYNLTVRSCSVVCLCGVCIATQDMTEEKLRALLEDSVTEHSHHCWFQPDFAVTSGAEGQPSNLLMSCQVCDTWTVIL
uniref:RPA-interacting protein n=1 Tax=Pogona vitticeps TaxID=103695 RepID=A0A6J0T548_9SAUR